MSQPSSKTQDHRSSRVPLRHLAALQAELNKLTFTADSDALQTRIIEGIYESFDCNACALILIEEANGHWIMRKAVAGANASLYATAQTTVSEELHPEWVYHISPRKDKGAISECLRTRRLININDTTTDDHFDQASDSPDGTLVRAMLCVPILANGQVLGAIQLTSQNPDAFSRADQDLIEVISGIAAGALSSLHLAQQLKIVDADLEASHWELAETQGTLNAVFDHLPDALYAVDAQLRLTNINLARLQDLGQGHPAIYSSGIPDRQSLLGTICYQALFQRREACPGCRVKHTLVEASVTQRHESRLVKGNVPGSPSSAELSNITGENDDSSANIRELEIYAFPVLDKNKHVTQAILIEHDVTEKRQLESLITQSEKLAAVGQLAAGIAHEINNPLTAIIANAQILHRSLPANDDLQESVDLIARAGARAAQVVRNLLDFARKEEYHLGLTNINETLEKALELVKHEVLAHGVLLEFIPSPDLPPILASQDHLQSVWLNLLLNAIDSLDKAPGQIKITTHRSGHEILVRIADNGKGIPHERLNRIFEAFYTTKAPGRGTGLGLSVSHRIVKQHGGHIRVESQVGKGSEFTVVLPIQ